MTGVFVQTPPMVAPGGGLLAAATVLRPADPHQFYGFGIDYEAELCGIASTVPDRCFDAYVTVELATGNNVTISVFNAPAEGVFTFAVDDEEPQTDSGPNPSVTTTGLSASEHTVVITDPDDFVVATVTWTSPLAEDDVISTAVKVFEGLDYVHGEPFTIYKGIECGLFGYEQYAPKARRALELAGPRAIEEHVWENVLPQMATDITPSSGAVSPAVALGMLEQYAGTVYAGTPVIHAGRLAAVLMGSDYLISGLAPLTTLNGSLLANGAGYVSLIGPDSESAEDGEAWMYATGQVTIRLSEIEVPAAAAYATNRYQAIAEQKVVPTVECFAVAIKVSLE